MACSGSARGIECGAARTSAVTGNLIKTESEPNSSSTVFMSLLYKYAFVLFLAGHWPAKWLAGPVLGLLVFLGSFAVDIEVV